VDLRTGGERERKGVEEVEMRRLSGRDKGVLTRTMGMALIQLMKLRTRRRWPRALAVTLMAVAVMAEGPTTQQACARQCIGHVDIL
jgi:hypothetical protein